jgi:hypothetical protein
MPDEEAGAYLNPGSRNIELDAAALFQNLRTATRPATSWRILGVHHHCKFSTLFAERSKAYIALILYHKGRFFICAGSRLL